MASSTFLASAPKALLNSSLLQVGDSRNDEHPPPSPTGPLSHKDHYALEALREGIIDANGDVLFPSQDRPTLEPSDVTFIRSYWNAPRNFNGCEREFSWNFHHFLKFLVPYFSNKPINGTVELLQGTHQTVGKGFWEKNLKRKVGDAFVDRCVTPEMWSFCTQPQRCFEFCIRLPGSAGKWTEEDHHRFQALIFYSLAVQSLTDLPQHYLEALREFSALLSDEIQTTRLTQLKQLIAEIKHNSKVLAVEDDPATRVIDIRLTSDTSLRVIFSPQPLDSSCFQLDQFRLAIGDDLTPRLICPSSPWNALHDHFLHRLRVLPSSKVSPLDVLGRYWAHLTCGGRVFQGEALESRLVDDLVQKYSHIKIALLAALTSGMRYLPAGKEATRAYYCNVDHFLSQHRVDPKERPTFIISNGEVEKAPDHPVNLLLHAPHSSTPFKSAWRLVAMLYTQLSCDAVQCRRTTEREQLEISWNDSNLYLVMPWNFEEELQQVKLGGPTYLSHLSHVLKAFSPSYLDVSSQDRTSHTPLIQIYRALCDDERYSEAALRLFFILHGGGWKRLDESDLLDLPVWLAHAAEKRQLPLLLERLTTLFQRSRIFSLFSSMKEKVLAVSEPSAATCLNASVSALVQCEEIKVLSAAWRFFAKEIPPRDGYTFLLESAPTLGMTALPFALSGVCELCNPKTTVLTTQERTSLLAKYLDRLIQTNQLQLPAYEQKLIELLEALVAAEPNLRSQLVFSRQVLQRVPSAKQSENALLQSLEESLPLLRTDPGAWWAKLLGVQSVLQEQGSFATHCEELDRIFERGLLTPGVNLSHRAGFVPIWERVAPRLFERGNLLPLLRNMSIAKSDRIFYPWLLRSLRQWMESKDPIEKGLAILALFRTSGAYQHAEMTRNTLVEILHHLTRRLVNENKAPLAAARREVHELTDLVSPKPAEIPQLLNYWLAYFSTVDRSNVGTIIEEMVKNLPLFVASKDQRFVSKVESFVTLLKENPLDRALWTKFAAFLDLLKKEDLCLDTSIRILEWLTTEPFLSRLSPNSPPVQCFKQPINQIGKKLSVTQRSRLAAAYKALVQQMVKTDNEKAILAALPPLNWLKELLLEGDHWLGFALLFFHLSARRRDNPQNALQEALEIAPCLLTLTRSPLLVDFAKFLGGVPAQRLVPAWKPHLAGLIALVPKCSAVNQLFAHLHQFAKGDEKRFFDQCQALHRTGSAAEYLTAYQRTQVVQEIKEVKPSAPAASSQTPSQPQTASALHAQLKSLPSDKSSPAWETFFTFFERVVRGEHPFPELDAFWALLDPAMKARLSLRLARRSNPLSNAWGERQFVTLLSEINRDNSYGSAANLDIFTLYCQSPYISRDPLQQQIVYQWIDMSWPCHKHTLNFLQACKLLNLLCAFEWTHEGQTTPSCDPATIFKKWTEVAQGSWKTKVGRPVLMYLANQPTSQEITPFFESTLALMDKIASDIPHVEERLHLLCSMHDRVDLYCAGYVETLAPVLMHFRFRWCCPVLASLPQICPSTESALKEALRILISYLPHTNGENETHIQAIKAFMDAIPDILGLDESMGVTPFLINTLGGMIKAQWISGANSAEEVNLFDLFSLLCCGIRYARPDSKKRVTKLVKSCFENCTQPAFRQIPNNDSKRVTSIAVYALAVHLLPLTELECLTTADWDSLFSGLLETEIDSMANELSEAHRSDYSEQFLFSLALARLIVHAKHHSETLSGLILSLMENIHSLIPPFELEGNVPFQLALRTQWILACRTLKEKFAAINFLPTLLLTGELAEQVLSHIHDEASYRTYSRYLLEAVGDDFQVAVQILSAFDDGHHQNPLQLRVKAFIEMKITKLLKEMHQSKGMP